MPKVTYTTEGGKQCCSAFVIEQVAKDWIEIAKERGWTARKSPTKKTEEVEDV